LAGRESDSVGLGVAYAAISGDARRLDRDAFALTGVGRPLRDFEAVVEITCQAQIAPWWIVQPDVQVILHPGGHAATPALAAGTSLA
jgi:porin